MPHRNCKPLLRVCFGLALFLAAHLQAAVLTNVSAIRRVPEESMNADRVRLRGIVTYFDAKSEQAFLQDSTGGIQFSVSDGDTNRIIVRRGQLVEISGRAAQGNYVRIVNGSESFEDEEFNMTPVHVRVLGEGILPPPRRLLVHEMGNPANHSQWVEIVGVVRSVETNSLGFSENKLSLQLTTTRGEFKAIIPAHSPSYNGDTLSGAVLQMRGVYGHIFSRFGNLIGQQLLVQEQADVSILDPGSWSFGARPVQRLNRLLRDPSGSMRVRVQGVVTMHKEESGFYIRDPSKWIWVQSPQSGHVNPGSQVDVVGFPTKEAGYPSLQDAIFTVIGSTNARPPNPVNPFVCKSGSYHGAFVEMEGEVVELYSEPGNQQMLLATDEVVYRVRLESDPRQELVIFPEPRSKVRIKGICVNDFRRRHVPVEGAADYITSSFHIELRSNADITILSAPPFWTFERVAWLMLASVAALALSIAWILALRRQVSSQTSLIQHKLEREAVNEERTRIARELHDSLEQNLAGIQMQLDAASGNMQRSPDGARETLDMARALLRHSRSETRRSVWELRSSALEGGDLESAFRELMVTLHRNTNVRISIGKSGEVLRMPASVENNILRIGQEAVNNAIEHGRAKQISIELEYGTHCTTLRIKDNGKGFDLEAAPATREGHFGLVGMRERARKIGGTLKIQSARKRGTLIELVLPMHQEPADFTKQQPTQA